MFVALSLPDSARLFPDPSCQTLTTFFSAVLPKKYTNPSSDIIAVLAGLDHVDQIFTDFVAALDAIIRNADTCK